MYDTKEWLLIVDNDPVVRYSLSQIFRNMGHTVCEAEDGFHALQEMGETVPSILIADLNMPRMSGFELLSIVRRRFPSVYVIGMLGSSSGALPEGVAADAFYRKATGLLALLKLVITGTEMDRVVLKASRKPAPIWIPPVAIDSLLRSHILLGCPECLRAFPHPTYIGGVLQETACVHCNAPIIFSVVEQFA